MGFIILTILMVKFVHTEWIPEMENSGNFEGDMILDPDQIKATKNGFHGYATTISKQWPGATVIYDYALTIQAHPRPQQVIQQAIDEYHEKTCIRFKKRTNEAHYIQFYVGPGCSSHVGYGGGKSWPMKVSLAQGCWKKGIVIHEIGHALGVFHEQSRPDRDDHVTIKWENIEKGKEFNFNKQKAQNIDSLGTSYDYHSIMHYGKTAFGIKKGGKRLVTIETKNPTKQDVIGNRRGLSDIDVTQLNKLYKCNGITPITKRPGVEETTKATMRPFTNNPNCRDTSRACPGWKSVCQSHKDVKEQCPKTCGAC